MSVTLGTPASSHLGQCKSILPEDRCQHSGPDRSVHASGQRLRESSFLGGLHAASQQAIDAADDHVRLGSRRAHGDRWHVPYLRGYDHHARSLRIVRFACVVALTYMSASIVGARTRVLGRPGKDGQEVIRHAGGDFAMVFAVAGAISIRSAHVARSMCRVPTEESVDWSLLQRCTATSCPRGWRRSAVSRTSSRFSHDYTTSALAQQVANQIGHLVGGDAAVTRGGCVCREARRAPYSDSSSGFTSTGGASVSCSARKFLRLELLQGQFRGLGSLFELELIRSWSGFAPVSTSSSASIVVVSCARVSSCWFSWMRIS